MWLAYRNGEYRSRTEMEAVYLERENMTIQNILSVQMDSREADYAAGEV